MKVDMYLKDKMLKELFLNLWLSSDFEEDLKENFPEEFSLLKVNENSIPNSKLAEMMKFLYNHPAFT